ncbi:hypothetical protein JN09_001330 [Acholeplasma morum]|uniref:hypothetical protein n=1 Tax=Paracholeplasma morum TaxID=264637 RepID=UPI00195B441C|nr:hypothetical protein [Paracholeplasma morum]MBM7453987.1 hypothetical protein [Paracholeplasma morum]
MPRKFTNSKLTEIVVNMFSMNEVMFIYYCGSDNYKTKQKKSDTDLTVVLNNFKGIIHASIDGVDIFAYGYEDFLQRQSITDTLPLYNLIHSDDVINMADNLIYLNPSYQTEYNNIITLKFEDVLPLYLDAVIEYFNQLVNVEKVIVKRSYHIIRIRGILEKYLETGKYDVNLNEVWLNKVFEHKKSWDKELNTPEHLTQLKTYLDEIITIREGLRT